MGGAVRPARAVARSALGRDWSHWTAAASPPHGCRIYRGLERLAEFADFSPCGDEGFLRDIFTRLEISRALKRAGTDQRLKAGHDFDEGILPPRSCGEDERGIGHGPD
jgi:hypothetical protein